MKCLILVLLAGSCYAQYDWGLPDYTANDDSISSWQRIGALQRYRAGDALTVDGYVVLLTDKLLNALITTEKLAHKAKGWVLEGHLKDAATNTSEAVLPILNAILQATETLQQMLHADTFKPQITTVAQVLPELTQALHGGSGNGVCVKCVMKAVAKLVTAISNMDEVKKWMAMGQQRALNGVWTFLEKAAKTTVGAFINEFENRDLIREEQGFLRSSWISDIARMIWGALKKTAGALIRVASGLNEIMPTRRIWSFKVIETIARMIGAVIEEIKKHSSRRDALGLDEIGSTRSIPLRKMLGLDSTDQALARINPIDMINGMLF